MENLDDFNMKSKKPWEVEGDEWKEVKLGEIGSLQYGYTQKAKHDKRGIKFLRITDIDLETSQVKWDNVPYCEIDNKNFAKYKLKDGDILIARIGGTTGKACIIKNPPDSVFASYLIRFCIADKENISPDFIYYFTKSRKYWDQISLDRIGKLKEGVNATQLKNLKIPLPFCNGNPDLETQKKIVEYIEANFSRIDKILEKKKKELEQLDELWESVLEQAFKPKEGEEWREVRFNELISKEKYQVGKVKVRNSFTDSGKIPVVDQGQELIRGYLDNEELKYRGPLPLIIFGDHTKVVKFIDFLFIVGADGVKILIPNEDLVCPKYFYWLLRTVKLPEKGYARHFKFLKQALYLIPFRNNQPDLEKQKEIANYLDSVYEKIKTLKEKNQKQIAQLEEMKESILDEMFNHENK